MGRAGLIVYTYLLYPCVLFLAYSAAQLGRDYGYLFRTRNRRVNTPPDDALPTVSVIVTEHYGRRLPAETLAALEDSYPREKLEILSIIDASSGDEREPEEWLRAGVRTVPLYEWRGKAAALNVGADRARGDILVFCDPGACPGPETLRNLVRHFQDEAMGMVCGTLYFRWHPETRPTERAFWWYDSALRLMESRLGATVAASGGIYAVRRQCYAKMDPEVILDALILPLQVRQNGYAVTYDPEASVVDTAAATVAEEYRRRVWLAIGSFRALPLLLRARLDAMTRFCFLSHKLLRWLLPFLLVAVLAGSAVLSAEPFYRGLLLAQAGFYLLAAAAALASRRVRLPIVLLIPYYAAAMALAFLVGFGRTLRHRASPSSRLGYHA